MHTIFDGVEFGTSKFNYQRVSDTSILVTNAVSTLAAAPVNTEAMRINIENQSDTLPVRLWLAYGVDPDPATGRGHRIDLNVGAEKYFYGHVNLLGSDMRFVCETGTVRIFVEYLNEV